MNKEYAWGRDQKVKDEYKRQYLQLLGSPRHGKNTAHGESWGGGGRHIQWSPEIQGPLAVTHRLLTARDGEGGGVSSSPLALESWLHQPPHSFSEIKETVSPQHCWTPLFLPWSAVLRCPRHYRLTNLPCRSNSFLWLILSIYLKLSDSHG